MEGKISAKDFEFLDEIGHGAYGTVYKARFKGDIRHLMNYRQENAAEYFSHRSTTRQPIFVVKRIPFQQQSKTHDKSRIMREANTMLKLCHPSLIHCYAAFSDNQYLYIVMEMAEEGNLDTFIKQKKAHGAVLTRQEFVRIAWELCEGVNYLHSHNIVHRDLKSTNILLSRNRSVKIADFGSSRLIHSEDELMNTHVGTPLYMAPEIILRKPYSTKADMWSLGCLLYLLATLRHPFQSKDFLGLYFSVLHDRPKPITPSETVPPSIATVIMLLFSQNPLQRPDAEQAIRIAFPMNLLREVVSNDTRQRYERGTRTGASPPTLTLSSHTPPDTSTNSAHSSRHQTPSKAVSKPPREEPQLSARTPTLAPSPQPEKALPEQQDKVPPKQTPTQLSLFTNPSSFIQITQIKTPKGFESEERDPAIQRPLTASAWKGREERARKEGSRSVVSVKKKDTKNELPTSTTQNLSTSSQPTRGWYDSTLQQKPITPHPVSSSALILPPTSSSSVQPNRWIPNTHHQQSNSNPRHTSTFSWTKNQPHISKQAVPPLLSPKTAPNLQSSTADSISPNQTQKSLTSRKTRSPSPVSPSLPSSHSRRSRIITPPRRPPSRPTAESNEGVQNIIHVRKKDPIPVELNQHSDTESESDLNSPSSNPSKPTTPVVPPLQADSKPSSPSINHRQLIRNTSNHTLPIRTRQDNSLVTRRSTKSMISVQGFERIDEGSRKKPNVPLDWKVHTPTQSVAHHTPVIHQRPLSAQRFMRPLTASPFLGRSQRTSSQQKPDTPEPSPIHEEATPPPFPQPDNPPPEQDSVEAKQTAPVHPTANQRRFNIAKFRSRPTSAFVAPLRKPAVIYLAGQPNVVASGQ